MELKDLQSAGAYVSRKLIKKEVALRRPVLKPESEWEDPEVQEFTDEIVDDSMTVYIRKRDSADLMELMGSDDREKASIAILRCVCKPGGTQVFESLDQVNQLADWLFIPLMMIVGEVNNFAPKNSQPRTSSGAKSRSLSAARSKKRSTVSAKKSARSGSNTGASAAP